MTNIPYPYHLCSAEQCRRMDERTINEFGIDSFTLMEVAGTRAADFILSQVSPEDHGLFLCGKGNNAGDALVIARLLSQNGLNVTVAFLSGTDSLSDDTSRNLRLLEKLRGDITITEWENITELSSYNFIVDGMLGTGLDSNVREPYASVIDLVNEAGLTVFALDLPTGLHADTGRILGTAIKADYTLSFGALKAGFYLNKGFDHTGEIILCDLPFPNHYREPAAYLIDRNWVDRYASQSTKRRHKYDGGVLYIIAGSEGLTGAAMLAAKSAWAAGVGAVELITPKGLLDIYEKNLLQIVKKPVGRETDKFFTMELLEPVLELLQQKKGKLVIGPGLGRSESTVSFTQNLLSSFEGDAVIDADGLYALAQMKKWIKPKASNWILTPHPGELSRLLATNPEDAYDRLIQASKKAQETQVTILAKGLPSIVSTKTGDALLTGYDTRIFSRAGFGDVLAGKIGAFWLNEKKEELVCSLALLDGKEKADNHILRSKKALEPLNII